MDSSKRYLIIPFPFDLRQFVSLRKLAVRTGLNRFTNKNANRQDIRSFRWPCAMTHTKRTESAKEFSNPACVSNVCLFHVNMHLQRSLGMALEIPSFFQSLSPWGHFGYRTTGPQFVAPFPAPISNSFPISPSQAFFPSLWFSGKTGPWPFSFSFQSPPNLHVHFQLAREERLIVL